MEQLTEFGVPETATALDDVRYVEMMAELRASRKEKLDDLGEEERRKYEPARGDPRPHRRRSRSRHGEPRGRPARGALRARRRSEAVPRVMGREPRDSLDTAALAEAMRRSREPREGGVSETTKRDTKSASVEGRRLQKYLFSFLFVLHYHTVVHVDRTPARQYQCSGRERIWSSGAPSPP